VHYVISYVMKNSTLWVHINRWYGDCEIINAPASFVHVQG